MYALLQELYTHWAVYLAMAGITFVNIIMPISGSSTQTPLIASITGNAHYAITISTWLLMLSCGIIAFVFRRDIRPEYVWRMLPTAVVAAMIGALLLVRLPDVLVTLFLLGAALHFAIKVFRHLEHKKEPKRPSLRALAIVGSLSGFLQGMGLPGGTVRLGYFYSEGLTVEEVRGTAELLTFFSFAAANVVRFNQNQLTGAEMFHWTIIFAPMLLIATYLGRHALIRLPNRVKDAIILLAMMSIIVSLTIRIARLL
ncbi:MAG TPA: sulfite exporter TauE/SafE family protein [Candidatus Paceibacterota bacterium]